MNADHRAGEFGPIYLPALKRIRDLWIELEPLVEAPSYDNIVGVRIGTTAGQVHEDLNAQQDDS